MAEELNSTQKLHLVSESRKFQNLMIDMKYTYNFTWFGRPIMQLPQDLYLVQELLWDVRPDLVIETGIAHGGSLIYYASILAIMEKSGLVQSPLVLGVDIDLRKHNRDALLSHPLSYLIKTLDGSSTDDLVLEKVREYCKHSKRVLVILDSNHTYEHVYQELIAYSPLVSKGSYCLVADTGIEFTPANLIGDRPWGPGNSPLTAVNQFLEESSDFILRREFQEKIWITAYYDGILQRKN